MCGDVVNDKAFPRSAGHGVALQVGDTGQAKQAVKKAAVAHINLVGLDQAFAQVGVKRFEPSHQKRPHHVVKPAGDRGRTHIQRIGKGRRIEELAMHMGKHAPKAAKAGRIHF